MYTLKLLLLTQKCPQLSIVCLQNMLSVSLFLFLFSGPKTISLLQKTKGIPIKLCILDSNSSEYELPDLSEESDSDLPDVTIPKQYKYCKFGQSITKGHDDKRTCKEPPSSSSTAQSRAEPSEVGHDNVSSTTTDSNSSLVFKPTTSKSSM